MLSIRISLVQTILLSIFLFQTLNGMKPDPPKQSAKHSVVEVEKSTPSTKEKITKIMLTKHVIPEFIQRRIPTIEGEFIRSVLKRGIQSLETEFYEQIQLYKPEGATYAESSKHCELSRYCTSDPKWKETRSIEALDKTRVKLTFETNTPAKPDFINANEVKPDPSLATNHPQHRFIATQAPIVEAYNNGFGPKKPTTVDFWRMILQEQASTIVMLAQIGAKSESSPILAYWPMVLMHTMTFDGISVKNLGVRNEKDFVVTTLEVNYSNGPVPLKVKHYRFLNWEDMKVADPMSLLKLLDEIRELPSPIVVHCSAGVGRAGTLISIEHGIMQFRNQRPINVKHIVENLRNQRPTSVQKAQQYVIIYMTLLHYAAEINPGYKAKVDEIYKKFELNLEKEKLLALEQAKKKTSEVSTTAESTSVVHAV